MGKQVRSPSAAVCPDVLFHLQSVQGILHNNSFLEGAIKDLNEAANVLATGLFTHMYLSTKAESLHGLRFMWMTT